MAIVLKSKPGLSSTTTLNIPTDWDPTWFRNFISNQLKGADVRNAVGSNGISVTGNISSPYATITFGGTANPINGPVIITGSGASPATAPLQINVTSAGGFGTVYSDGTNTQSYLGFGEASHQFQIGTVGAFELDFVTSNAIRMLISSGGNITLNAPTTGNTLVVNGNTNSSPEVINAGVGQYGLQINGGSFAGITLVSSTGTEGTNDLYLFQNTGVGASYFGTRSATTLNIQTNSATRLSISGTGAVSLSGNLGINGNSPVAQNTGWGTPTGAAVVTNFPGATATLVQCSEVISQLLTLFKLYGILGA